MLVSLSLSLQSLHKHKRCRRHLVYLVEVRKRSQFLCKAFQIAKQASTSSKPTKAHFLNTKAEKMLSHLLTNYPVRSPTTQQYVLCDMPSSLRLDKPITGWLGLNGVPVLLFLQDFFFFLLFHFFSPFVPLLRERKYYFSHSLNSKPCCLM